MRPIVQSVRDLKRESETLRVRPYGMIEVAQGKLVRIQLKPWPKIGSVVEAKWISGWKNRVQPADSLRLYYNQPIGSRRFLALTYAEASRDTSFKTILTSLRVLDHVAYLKKSNAILAEVSNDRITDRMLERFGWERHLEHSKYRHWIKRFWGKFPESASVATFEMAE